MKPRSKPQAWRAGVKLCKSHMTWNSWPHEPMIIPIKNNYKCFDTLSLPTNPSHIFFPPWELQTRAPLPHSQFLPLTLPGTRPLTCQGGKVLRKGKKNLNHGRDSAVLLVWQVLWAQSGVERRRRGQKLNICAHLYTSLVPQTVYGELNASFWILFPFLLRPGIVFAHRFCHVSVYSCKEPSHETWSRSDCTTVSMTAVLRGVFKPHVALFYKTVTGNS